MRKLEELYELYIDKGLLTEAVSLSDFKNADEDQVSQLYTAAKDNGCSCFGFGNYFVWERPKTVWEMKPLPVSSGPCWIDCGPEL